MDECGVRARRLPLAEPAQAWLLPEMARVRPREREREGGGASEREREEPRTETHCAIGRKQC